MASRPAQINFTYKKCTGENIVEWCKANDKVSWLKIAAADNGNFLNLKRAFFQEFFPELIPVAKPKKKPLWQTIENL